MRKTASIASIAVMLVALLAIGATGVAVADDHNATSSPEGNATGDEATTVVSEVDEQLRVTGYEYDPDREIFTVELQNTGSSSSYVTITEMISSSDANSGSFGIEQLTVRSGETVDVEVSVRERDGTAGVMIVSERSLRKGTGSFLRVETDAGPSLFEGEATWNTARISGLSAAGAAGLLLIVYAWHRVASRKFEVNLKA